MWTSFMDMHSGGPLKEEPYSYIFIQAPFERAKQLFIERFGHDPDNVTCNCCGADYSISECPTLEVATDYERRAVGMTLGEYLASPYVLVIPDIDPLEQLAEL